MASTATLPPAPSTLFSSDCQPAAKPVKTVVFDSKGVKRSEIHHQEGRLHGAYRTWYSTGTREYSLTYRNDKLHGPGRHWNEQGICTFSVQYKHGLEDGAFYTAYDDGTTRTQGWFENGQTKWFIAFEADGSIGSCLDDLLLRSEEF